jgi:hypothetical protein
MANNVFTKTVALDTATWTPIADVPTVVSCVLQTPSSNGTAPVLLRYDGGDSAEISRGASFPLVRVDVSLVEAKAGSDGDKLTVVGGTW